jgi:hypothetical protein
VIGTLACPRRLSVPGTAGAAEIWKRFESGRGPGYCYFGSAPMPFRLTLQKQAEPARKCLLHAVPENPLESECGNLQVSNKFVSRSEVFGVSTNQ